MAQLADVFAHVSKKITHSKNPFTIRLHGLMEEHFNLFDHLQNNQDVIEKGIFDVQNSITEQMVKKEMRLVHLGL